MRVEEKVCRYRVGGGELLAAVLGEYTEYHVVEYLLRVFEPILVEHEEGAELLLARCGAWTSTVKDCSLIYTLGLHVLSMRSGKLLPTLSLGQLIEHSIVKCYVVLPERLVSKLTYGKSLVVDPKGLEMQVEGCKRVAVLTRPTRRFVAWASVSQVEGGKLLIKPLVDVGWYLRSGV